MLELLEPSESVFGHVYSGLLEVREARGKAKQAELKRIASDPDAETFLKWVLTATYEPYIVYGIKKAPKGLPESDETYPGFAGAARLLQDLSERRLTGNAAVQAYAETMAGLSPQGRDLLSRIIGRDMKIGVNRSTIHAVFPGLLSKFNPMLAHPYEAKRIKQWPVGVEIKYDGVRVLAFVTLPDHGPVTVDFLSRSGRPFTSFGDTLAGELAELGDSFAYAEHKTPCTDCAGGDTTECSTCSGQGYQSIRRCKVVPGQDTVIVFDGEVVTGNFNDTVSSVRKKNAKADDAVFHVFEALTFDEFTEGTSLGSNERYHSLADLIGAEEAGRRQPMEAVKLSRRQIANSDAAIHAMAEDAMGRGYEGVIVKPFEGGYEPKRSYQWLKIKAENSEDLRIKGAYEGEAGTKYEGMLGGVIVDFNGEDVGVGSGFSDDQRASLWRDYQLDLVEGVEWSGEEVCEVGRLINRVAEIEYHEVTPAGSLRHSRFNRFRDTAYPGHKE